MVLIIESQIKYVLWEMGLRRNEKEVDDSIMYGVDNWSAIGVFYMGGEVWAPTVMTVSPPATILVVFLISTLFFSSCAHVT